MPTLAAIKLPRPPPPLHLTPVSPTQTEQDKHHLRSLLTPLRPSVNQLVSPNDSPTRLRYKIKRGVQLPRCRCRLSGASTTMTDYREEQNNEIEALESIYPEEFETGSVEWCRCSEGQSGSAPKSSEVPSGDENSSLWQEVLVWSFVGEL
ncbi:hypothetical protein GWK47_030119 [Chionoecetes opilio]|uniref:RWD domain-containing protein n=1 Tax=Chionoecetes opilio TaxID=41210 RepID=A0A8J5CR65_CHIOP|nr:hypothetical protein GWK47_030119 [Chionoecetes opilio]